MMRDGTYVPLVPEEFADKIYEMCLIQHCAMNILELFLVKCIQHVLEKLLCVRIARHRNKSCAIKLSFDLVIHCFGQRCLA